MSKETGFDGHSNLEKTENVFRGDLNTRFIINQEVQKRKCDACETADCNLKKKALLIGRCPNIEEDPFADERESEIHE